MYNLFYKLIRKLNKKTYSLLNRTKEQQTQILINLEKTNMDEIQRSYAQYKCQMTEKGSHIIFLNIISLLMIFPFTLYCLLVNISLNYKLRRVKEKSKEIAVFFGAEISNIPNSLSKKYIIKEFIKKFTLELKDMYFIWREVISKYPLSCYFIFKIIFKISLYRTNINFYNPDCFIVTSEYSFTSSILTKYCETNKIQHFNVMHGEKLFNITDSFFYFHKCYVWDDHYIQLFMGLKAETSQFIVALPPAFSSGKGMICRDSKGKRNLTYYLLIDNAEQLIKINHSLKKLEQFFNIIVRPHPRYCDIGLVKVYFPNYTIENPHEVGIFDSIQSSDYLVSLYSTVLYQGYLYDKTVVIDDLVDKKYYEKLRELDYIMVYKPHKRLSEIIETLENRTICHEQEQCNES